MIRGNENDLISELCLKLFNHGDLLSEINLLKHYRCSDLYLYESRKQNSLNRIPFKHPIRTKLTCI